MNYQCKRCGKNNITHQLADYCGKCVVASYIEKLIRSKQNDE